MQDYTRGADVGPEDRGAQVAEAVRDRASEQVDRQSTAAGEQAEAAGGAMRRAGAELRDQGSDLPGQLAERAADQLERVGRYLRESDGETMLRDAQDFARRQPWLVAGIALAAGFAGARLLKAMSR